MTSPRLENAWTTFRMLADSQPVRAVVQHLNAMEVPQDLIAACIERHERETARIVEAEEPLRTGREDQLNWYTGPRSGDKNWPAFRKQLTRTLDDEAIKKIDEASSVVVSMLDHPGTQTFRSRGLVVGHVQSGKTSNFTAVISKAADRGYRMFIVLSGIHNSLRRQTQSRLIRDVVELNAPLWHQITKAETDFVPPGNAASLLTSKDQTLLLVVKKNAPVLRKLRSWLRGAKEHLGNCPALIIDDEADQATVATRTINPLITDIIDCFPKVCYVGYTATPFANLLIDPSNEKDFYPKDFVLSLPRGGDYQGAEELFGRDPVDGEDPNEVPGGLDMIRTIPDNELPELRPANRAQAASFEPTMTPSLRSACLWFWLATAARRVRGQTDAHSSMLIHAHSDTRVHDSFREPLTALRSEIVNGLRTGESAVVGELRMLWETENGRVPLPDGARETSLDEVVEALTDVVAGTRIVMDHYRSNDRLDYTGEASTVIAVGGNTLSRGLTLEGLVVSVFVRSANVYDTLLQMGRWFGYRPGYSDLPRIWMPVLMSQWFAHLATVEAEMRAEIDRYLVEHRTPLELAVRIKTHPKMRVTAPSKEGSMIRASAAFGGELVESRYFPTFPDDDAQRWHERNARAVDRLLRAAHAEGTGNDSKSGSALWRAIPTDAVLEFLDDYRFHGRSTDIDGDLMAKYISRRRAQGGLASWNVGVVGVPAVDGEPGVVLPDGRRLGFVNRTRLISNKNDPVADIKTLTGSRDPALDLDLGSTTGPDKKVTRTNLRRWRVQQQPERGLVLLYPIASNSTSSKDSRADLNAPGEYIWGAAFVFPEPSHGDDVLVEYDYVSADLSKVYAAAVEDGEDIDTSVLQEDLDEEAGVA